MMSRKVPSVTGGSDTVKTVLNILCRRTNCLKVCHFNSQSLLSKADEFHDIFSTVFFDLIFVSETWFKNYFPTEQIMLPNYKLFRNDRVSHGGGVAIYAHSNITARVVGLSSATSVVEFIFIEAVIDNTKCLFGCVYKPPKILNLAGTELETFLGSNCHSYSHICIAGDFNFNLLSDDSVSNNFIDFVKSYGLHFANNTCPTHFTSNSSSLLDLFLLSDTNLIDHYDQVSAPVFSKHDLIFLSLNLFHSSSNELNDMEFVAHDFNQVNLTALLKAADDCNWQSIHDAYLVDEQIDIFNSFITSLFNKFVPLKSYKANNGCPWYTDRIRSLSNSRDRAYHCWKCFRTCELLQKYKSLRNKVVFEIRKSKKSFFQRKLNLRLPPKTLWKNLRYLGVGHPCQSPPPDLDLNELNLKFVDKSNNLNKSCDLDIPINADGFAFPLINNEDVFRAIFSIKSNAVGADGIHPKFIKTLAPIITPHITHIFNNIKHRSSFPSVWKRAKVLPIPKKSKSTTPEYRPIAILPFLSKVFERIISNQITDYIDKNNMMHDLQSGFRKNKSCISALLKISDDIRIAFDKDMITVLVLLDFSKAFDSVDHHLLISKLLNNFGFSSSAAKLVFSYLLFRSQFVFANNNVSSSLFNFKGVPQGSILGPLLFSMFINDLPNVINNCLVHIYADDVQIYLSRPVGLLEDALVRINEDLVKICDWSSTNRLVLNASKSIGIPFSRNNIVISDLPVLKLGSSILPFASSVTNLGVKFDSKLSWSEQVNSIIYKVYGILRKLSVSAYFTPSETRLRLVKSLVIPLINFGCELYAGANVLVMRKLEIAFNAATRYVFGLKRYDHISEYRTSLLGCNLFSYLSFRSLLFLRKLVLSRKPDYLYRKITFDDTTRSLYITPSAYKYLSSERQFFVRSIRLWNGLPIDIKRQYGSSRFKKILFNHFTSH